MTLRVCLNRLVFLLFSLARELSPFRLHEHVLSLLVSKLVIISLVVSHFNSLPPASLFLELLHFNCDFHGYLTRSRSTCIKCPSGINLKSAKNIEKHGETGENVEKQRNTGRIKKKHRKTLETRDNVGKTGKCIET